MADKRIPIAVQDKADDIEIDGARVARGLRLEVAVFRRLLDAHKIRVLCERGTGEHAGLHRVSFYHEGRRVRLVVDAAGNLVRGSAMPLLRQRR